MLDFSRIEQDRRVAVHCQTEEDADIFLRELRTKHPTKYFFAGGNNWAYYKGNTCYWPNFFGHDLQYGSLEYARDNGYHVVEFESLLAVQDLPIDEYEVDIKSLFGME